MDESEIENQRSQMVVKKNELVQCTRFRLTATQQKFLAYLVSKIKPTDQEVQELEVRVQDFCEITGIDKNYFYSDFIKMINDFDNRTFWVNLEDELYKFYWFSSVAYLKGSGTIRLKLSDRLSEYLIGLSENFTAYELSNILALRSKYSIRLYEIFKSYEFQQKKKFDLEELKELLNAETYKKYKDFRVRVLEPATKEINEYTDLQTSFEPIYNGKKIDAIKFTISKKKPSDRYKSYKKTVEKIEAGRS